eukprot:76192-Pleurochrysis_carterae.AAC.2
MGPVGRLHNHSGLGYVDFPLQSEVVARLEFVLFVKLQCCMSSGSRSAWLMSSRSGCLWSAFPHDSIAAHRSPPSISELQPSHSASSRVSCSRSVHSLEFRLRQSVCLVPTLLPFCPVVVRTSHRPPDPSERLHANFCWSQRLRGVGNTHRAASWKVLLCACNLLAASYKQGERCSLFQLDAL